jgi:hypothetical protein
MRVESLKAPKKLHDQIGCQLFRYLQRSKATLSKNPAAARLFRTELRVGLTSPTKGNDYGSY